MSNEAIAYAKAQKISSSPQKLLYLLLADRVDNETGKCFPGQKLLAEEATMSERQVREHLRGLEDAHYIERTKRFRQDGSPTSDEYTFPGFLSWMHGMQQSARDHHEAFVRTTSGGNPPVVGKRRDQRRVSVSTSGGNPPPNPKRNPKRNPQSFDQNKILIEKGRQIELEDAISQASTQVTGSAQPKAKTSRKRTIGSVEFESFWLAYRSQTNRQPGSKQEASKAFSALPAHLRSIQIDRIGDYRALCEASASKGSSRPMVDAVRYIRQGWAGQMHEEAELRKVGNQSGDGLSGEDKTLLREWLEYLRSSVWPTFGYMQKQFSGPDSVPEHIQELGRRMIAEKGGAS